MKAVCFVYLFVSCTPKSDHLYAPSLPLAVLPSPVARELQPQQISQKVATKWHHAGTWSGRIRMEEGERSLLIAHLHSRDQEGNCAEVEWPEKDCEGTWKCVASSSESLDVVQVMTSGECPSELRVHVEASSDALHVQMQGEDGTEMGEGILKEGESGEEEDGE